MDTPKKPVPVTGNVSPVAVPAEKPAVKPVKVSKPAAVVGASPKLTRLETIMAGTVKLVYEKPPEPPPPVNEPAKAKKKRLKKRRMVIRKKPTGPAPTGLARHLVSWVRLNDALMEAGENKAKELLDLEVQGKARKAFILRIHARYNRARATRERVALANLARDYSEPVFDEVDDESEG